MKITYSNVQPNSKESKLWLDSKGQLRTYNTRQFKWIQGSLSKPDDTPDDKPDDTPSEEPEEHREIEFTIDCTNSSDTGVMVYKALEGMTWGEFIETGYNTDSFFALEYNDEIIIAVTQIWGTTYRVLSNDQQTITSTLTIVPGYTYTVTNFMI